MANFMENEGFGTKTFSRQYPLLNPPPPILMMATPLIEVCLSKTSEHLPELTKHY